MFKWIGRIFRADTTERVIAGLDVIVDQINALEPEVSTISDEQLRARTDMFRRRLNEGETLDTILPSAFAIVREAARRTIGQRHHDVQLIGGIVLHQGKIAEMKTGEGKTLVATLPLYLNALEGKGCHLITVNDYLVRVGAGWMGPIYHLLGRQRQLYLARLSRRSTIPTIWTPRPIWKISAWSTGDRSAAAKPMKPISSMAPTTSLALITCVTISRRASMRPCSDR